MLTITPAHTIWLACQPVDFRKGIDGFAALVRTHLAKDPFGGQCYIFCNSSRTAIKVLLYDGNGFWLCHKRLSRGKFTRWPKSGTTSVRLDGRAFSALLSG
ncbi:TPA: IS66 family insertion sequence element accessory protein TnpB [Legionella pneumophila]|nr:IS66 family insertion sequence element accessory protein TnpB [Legionella pneumophila]HAU3959236.1 IS66 family insertion sequence element accessory protein TnpB [Legionella pneumophila]